MIKKTINSHKMIGIKKKSEKNDLKKTALVGFEPGSLGCESDACTTRPRTTVDYWRSILQSYKT